MFTGPNPFQNIQRSSTPSQLPQLPHHPTNRSPMRIGDTQTNQDQKQQQNESQSLFSFQMPLGFGLNEQQRVSPAPPTSLQSFIPQTNNLLFPFGSMINQFETHSHQDQPHRLHNLHSEPPSKMQIQGTTTVSGGTQDRELERMEIGRGGNGTQQIVNSGGGSGHPGEQIPGKFYQYHSIFDELSQLIMEKHHIPLGYMSLSESRKNLNLIWHKKEMIQNILPQDQFGRDIIDFVIIKSNLLCILYDKELLFFDLNTEKLSNDQISFPLNQITIIPHPLEYTSRLIYAQMNKVEECFIIIGKQALSSLAIQISLKSKNWTENLDFQVTQYQIGLEVKDINLSGNFLSILSEKNEVQVIDLKQKQQVFKAQYRDSSGQLQRLFYLNPRRFFQKFEGSPQKDFEDDTQSYENNEFNQENDINEEENDINRFIDDEVVDDEEYHQEGNLGDSHQKSMSLLGGIQLRQKRLPLFQSATKSLTNQPRSQKHQDDSADGNHFTGWFLFVEQKSSSTSKAGSHNTSNPTSPDSNFPYLQNIQSFEKLCLVRIVNKVPKVQDSKKKLQNEQSLDQIDTLKLSDKVSKFAYYDERTGLVLLMNQDEIRNQALKIYIIRIQQQMKDQSDSDSEEEKLSPQHSINFSVGNVKFSFIRELRLNVSNKIFDKQAIEINCKEPLKYPISMEIARTFDEFDKNMIVYQILTSVNGNILTHLIKYSDTIQDQSSTSQFFMNQPKFQHDSLMTLGAQSFFDDPQRATDSQSINQINTEALQFDKPSSSLNNTVSFGNQQDSQYESKKNIKKMYQVSEMKNMDKQEDSKSEIQELEINLKNLIQDMTQGISSTSPVEESKTDFDQLEDENQEKEQVKRELEEAIEKDLQIPLVPQDLKQEEIDSQQYETEQKQTIEQQQLEKQTDVSPTPTTKPNVVPGEIRLNPDQFKAVTQSKQLQAQQQQQQTTGSKKKKKSKAKPANVAGNASPIVNSRSRQPSPVSITNQSTKLTDQIKVSSQTSTSLLQSQNQEQQLQHQKSQVSTATAKQSTNQNQNQNQQASKKQKALQEQLLDNFGELTKKYQELTQKFQKVQDQLTNQSTQQAELDRTISTNIQKYLPLMVEQQMREQVVPLVLSHMKGIDRKIKEEIMPQIEGQMQDIVVKLVKENKLAYNPKEGDGQAQGKGFGGLLDVEVQNNIRQIVVEEFSQSMNQSIKPMLEDQFKGILENVKLSLQQVNLEFSSRLQEEEEKNKAFIDKYSSKIENLPTQEENLHIHSLPPQPYMNYSQPYPHYQLPHQQYYPRFSPYYGGHPIDPYYNIPPPPLPPYHPSAFQAFRDYPSPQEMQFQQHPTQKDLTDQYKSLSKESSVSNQRDMAKTSTGQIDARVQREQPYPYLQGYHYAMQNQYYTPYPHPYYNPHEILQMNRKPQSQNVKAERMNQLDQYLNQDLTESNLHHQEQEDNHQSQTTQQNLHLSLNQQQSRQNPLTASTNQSQLTETFSFNPNSHKPQQIESNVKSLKIASQDQEVLMYDDQDDTQQNSQNQQRKEEIKMTNIRKSNTNPPVNTQKDNQSPKENASIIHKSQSQGTNGSGTTNQSNENTSSNMKVEESKINWNFLPMIKEIATKGKPIQADFLLVGNEGFLRDAISTVQNNSRIITNQYKGKIIHQFIKKVYQRAKDSEKARKGALEIISVFIEKIYKERSEMKSVYIQQASQWEEEIRKLLQG